jgi:hypothetical protein
MLNSKTGSECAEPLMSRRRGRHAYACFDWELKQLGRPRCQTPPWRHHLRREAPELDLGEPEPCFREPAGGSSQCGHQKECKISNASFRVNCWKMSKDCKRAWNLNKILRMWRHKKDWFKTLLKYLINKPLLIQSCTVIRRHKKEGFKTILLKYLIDSDEGRGMVGEKMASA